MTVTRDGISQAAHRIAPFVRRTPVVDVKVEGVALPVTLKLELLQHSGSFKARGAFNNLVGRAVGAGGVATASGGNHGAAVAYVCQQLGHVINAVLGVKVHMHHQLLQLSLSFGKT